MIAVSQRVDSASHYPETRDGLDQRWWPFFERANICPLILPNCLSLAQKILTQIAPDGILLTGGNSHESCNGNAPERDQLDAWLIELAIARNIPLLGVCRGMQSIQIEAGQILEPVDGQIQPSQAVLINGVWQEVNSFHSWGTYQSHAQLQVWATGAEGVVKAIRHETRPIWGIMWHPERIEPYREADITFFRQVFKT